MADAPQGYRNVPEAEQKKAKAFYDKAQVVAGTGNFEYAIELYLQGLALDPDAKEAHQALRDTSLKRKAMGGKDLGMMEKMRLKRPSKDDRQNMLAAERMMAYEPGNTDNMLSVLQSAAKAGFFDTVMWVGPILLRANADCKSPDFNKFLILKEAYKDLGLWKAAQEALQYAIRVKPDEMDLHQELKNLAAHDTMKEGNYEAGDWRQSMRGKDEQQRLIEESRDVRSLDLLTRQIMEADAAYKADPVDGRMLRLVELLEKTEDVENENRAQDLLEEWFKNTRQFRFRQRIGKIQMAQYKRQERMLRQAMLADPDNEPLKREYDEFRHGQIQFELKEFSLWAENYPTDLGLKYETAARMFALGRYEESIQFFQQARQDPKLKVDGSVSLGRAFLEAGFVDEAIETLQQVSDEYQLKGDDKSKLMNYWLGRAFEASNNMDSALKRYSQVAQWEFMYKDVQQRIKRLRAAAKGQQAPELPDDRKP